MLFRSIIVALAFMNLINNMAVASNFFYNCFQNSEAYCGDRPSFHRRYVGMVESPDYNSAKKGCLKFYGPSVFPEFYSEKDPRDPRSYDPIKTITAD